LWLRSKPQDPFVAKPNYQFEKRQKELAKKKQRDEKQQRRVKTPTPAAPDGSPPPAAK
jgi:hypothetical protein